MMNNRSTHTISRGSVSLVAGFLLIASCAAVGTPPRVMPSRAEISASALTSSENTMLALVNAARAEARNCGGVVMPAVPALVWEQNLSQAAAVHSRDQAARQEMSHRGSDGSTVAARATRVGYVWRAVGENVYTASWAARADEAVAAWLTSAGHCRNIMSANFTALGAGASDVGTHRYWTQVFAAPRATAN